MGRYTSVQAFTDQNPNMRLMDYATATAKNVKGDNDKPSNSLVDPSKQVKGLKTEKTENLYGSTAGAGSGEFHTYRHSRARENKRLDKMDADEKEQLEQEQFDLRVKNNKEECEGKTDKRRKKREKAKMNKRKRETGQKFDLAAAGGGSDDDEDNEVGPKAVKKPKPVAIANDGNFLEMMLAR